MTGALPIHVSALEMEPSLLEGDRGGEMYMMEKNDWYQYADPPVMYQAYDAWPAQRDQLVRELLSGSITGEELLAEMDATGPGLRDRGRPAGHPRGRGRVTSRKAQGLFGSCAFCMCCHLSLLLLGGMRTASR